MKKLSQIPGHEVENFVRLKKDKDPNRQSGSLLKKLIIEQQIKNDKRINWLLACVCLVMVVLAIGRVLVANRLVEASGKFHDLDGKIAQLQADNQALSEKNRDNESLTFSQNQASSLGFVASKSYIVLKPTDSIAAGPLELLSSITR